MLEYTIIQKKKMCMDNLPAFLSCKGFTEYSLRRAERKRERERERMRAASFRRSLRGWLSSAPRDEQQQPTQPPRQQHQQQPTSRQAGQQQPSHHSRSCTPSSVSFTPLAQHTPPCTCRRVRAVSCRRRRRWSSRASFSRFSLSMRPCA